MKIKASHCSEKKDVKYVFMPVDESVEDPPKRYSGRPLCYLTLGIFATCALSWVGATYLADHLNRPRVFCNPIYPPKVVEITRSVQSGPPLQCAAVPVNSRFDCAPGYNVSAAGCHARGCCWLQPPSDLGAVQHNIPYCFYPAGYNSHKVLKIEQSQFGVSVWYQRLLASGYPDDYDHFRLDIVMKKNNMIQIKIYNETDKNPYLASGEKLSNQNIEFGDLHVQIAEDKFGFRIFRSSTGQVLFDTMDVGGFIFSKQMLQISTLLPSHFIYGLGEHTSPLLKNTNWFSYIMWNTDVAPESNTANMYGSHPFYMALDNEGNAHGVSFLNSHAMEIALQPTPALTYRVLGGIFNINIMLGPTPVQVVEQYLQLIGTPFLIPYWSLGYHQCKYGYGSLANTSKVLKRTMEAGIPIDTQWNDIDYMDSFRDFTYDKKNYKGLPEFVEELHKNGMHYVQIIDPGISGTEPKGTYPPLDMGLEMDIFIRNASDQPFVGKVWNTKSTVWPDFTHPKALDYWYTNLKTYHDSVPIDGAWIDMNEPSNFADGSVYGGCAKDGKDHLLDDPPFVPKGIRGNALFAKTVCPSARQYYGYHYEYHNLFGLTETMATATAMRRIRGKRALVVSRSTFPGQGHYGAHWTGDVFSTWDDMRYSISTIINMNMFGIPMVGADICGFNGDTTKSLCNRWMQLGAFYPFSRNHNNEGQTDQDPVAMGPTVVESSKNALNIRYKILPFLYTQMVKAHLHGTPPFRAMFMNFPEDKTTFDLDRQVMWGQEFMVLPVLEDNATSVTGYFPRGTWYDYHNAIDPIEGPKFVKVDAPLTRIPLFVRGGSVLPTQRNASTTVASRQNPHLIRVYFPTNDCFDDCKVEGELIVDDGDSLTGFDAGNFTYVQFVGKHNHASKQGQLVSVVLSDKYVTQPLVYISIHGLKAKPAEITLDGKPVKFYTDAKLNMVGIPHLNSDLRKSFELVWKLK